ncbi:MAG: YraN family protein [Flavobacteriales bacterium]|nr:YraN family protein [Flavobacteriales bacterium]MDG1780867.1 YraN family protein [Flavobacteriales bacterium]MDG2246708.1 YraN family protein [Flavobacteriales bacterium]
MTTTEKGNLGEQLASEHLVQNGYTILAKQWRFGRNEIDLIAQKEEDICFVEVKLRDNDWGGKPFQFVSKDKQRRVIKAAHHYLNKHADDHLNARFDIISIIHNAQHKSLEHIENAFFPML